MEWKRIKDENPTKSGFYFTYIDKRTKGVSYYDKDNDEWMVLAAVYGNENSQVSKWLCESINKVKEK